VAAAPAGAALPSAVTLRRLGLLRRWAAEWLLPRDEHAWAGVAGGSQAAPAAVLSRVAARCLGATSQWAVELAAQCMKGSRLSAPASPQCRALDQMMGFSQALCALRRGGVAAPIVNLAPGRRPGEDARGGGPSPSQVSGAVAQWRRQAARRPPPPRQADINSTPGSTPAAAAAAAEADLPPVNSSMGWTAGVRCGSAVIGAVPAVGGAAALELPEFLNLVSLYPAPAAGHDTRHDPPDAVSKRQRTSRSAAPPAGGGGGHGGGGGAVSDTATASYTLPTPQDSLSMIYGGAAPGSSSQGSDGHSAPRQLDPASIEALRTQVTVIYSPGPKQY
jgi:hypothetical protein